jgi:hypothetical protein
MGSNRIHVDVGYAVEMACAPIAQNVEKRQDDIAVTPFLRQLNGAVAELAAGLWLFV